MFGAARRKMRLMESNAKCRHLKKMTCKGTLQKVFICLKPHSPSLGFWGFCMGWSSNSAGSESGQIQSVKLLAEYGLQQDSTPPTLLWHREWGRGGGRVEPERRLEGQQFTKLGRKYQHDLLYLQSTVQYKLWLTPAAKSLYRLFFYIKFIIPVVPDKQTRVEFTAIYILSPQFRPRRQLSYCDTIK